eukprot:scaffold22960_cov36-Prasinocladus_malaysianus.AAC.1
MAQYYLRPLTGLFLNAPASSSTAPDAVSCYMTAFPYVTPFRLISFGLNPAIPAPEPSHSGQARACNRPAPSELWLNRMRHSTLRPRSGLAMGLFYI